MEVKIRGGEGERECREWKWGKGTEIMEKKIRRRKMSLVSIELKRWNHEPSY